MSDKIMSISELAEMQKSFTEATHSDEPVAIQTPTTNVVNGDPRKTGLNISRDYTLTLWLPVTEDTPKDSEFVLDGTSYIQEVKAKQKRITPSVARRIRNYASTIAIAFTEFKEDGTSELYTAEDIMKVYEVFDDDVINACENMVKLVLGVPDSVVEYITDVSLMETCSLILKNNPSFFQND